MLKTLRTIDPGIIDALVEATSDNGGAVALERDGKPAVVVISPNDYDELIELRAAHFEALLDRSAATFDDMTEEEKDAWAAELVDAVRKERFEAGLHR